jgi:multiple sugar transport system substrate-binding protein
MEESGMRTRRVRLLGTAAAVALMSGIAACGSAPASNTVTSASSCQPPKGKVNITLWSWEAGIGPMVTEFNKTHPDIHVTLDTIASGNYQSMFDALKAGKGPDVAMIEYDELPQFRLNNGLTSISDCAPVKNISSQFPAWTVSQVGAGSKAVYAIPEDIEPLALYYRKDIFAKYHLTLPTTWAQYEADALKLKAENPAIKMTAMTASDYGVLTGLDWQNGAELFSYSGNTFTFNMNSPQATQVANYWQGLLNDGVINTTANLLSPAEYAAWSDGTVATAIEPDYVNIFMSASSPKAKDDWAIAPLPQWKAGENADANDGGSSTAVLAGTKQPYADAVFVDWLGANSVTYNDWSGSVLSAANAYLNNPKYINVPNSYYGGQKILQVFKAGSAGVNTSFQWAPNQGDVNTYLTNALEGAFNGSSTIEAAFATAQSQGAANLKSEGVTVNVK